MSKVTQADRDAAAAIVYMENKSGLNWASAEGMRDHVAEGKWDWHPVVQAFARHRMEERAKIVAWLRDQDGHGYDAMRADCIEAGEHMK